MGQLNPQQFDQTFCFGRRSKGMNKICLAVQECWKARIAAFRNLRAKAGVFVAQSFFCRNPAGE